MEGTHNDRPSADPPMTPIERQIQGPPTLHDENQRPPQRESRLDDQEADSRQVTRRRDDEVEKTPPPSRHRAESAARSSRGPDDKKAHLEEELHEMRKQMGDMKNSLKAKAARNLDNLVHRANSPFIPSITNFPLPPRFKVLPLENFDGTKDLFDYLEAFKTIMQLQAVPEEIMCRVFPMGLRGSARRRGRPPTHLLSVKQMEGKSLRAYVHRFNKEAMQIDRPKEDVTLTAFMAGLGKGDFLYDLYKDLLETLSELMYEAQKHMNVEDALEALDDPPPKRRKEVENHKQEPAKQKVPKFSETPGRKRTTTPIGKFSSFMPLNTPIDKLLMQIQDDPSLRWPSKIGFDPNSRPKNLYCRKASEICQSPDNARPPKPQGPKEQTENPKPGTASEIRTIVGGPTVGGISRTSEKHMPVRQRQLGRYPLPTCIPENEVRQEEATTHGSAPLVGFTSDKICPVGAEGKNQTMTIEERKTLVEPSEELSTIILDDESLDKSTRIGANITSQTRESIIHFLKNNKDVFAWNHKDMPGYNQIVMDEEDQEKTSFITSRGLFCYKVMPFGLKNAGATYQRLMNQMFHYQIGKNIEVYIDDMLVKSREEDDHLKDIKETFNTLRKYQMRLNPSKCAFGVSSGKFLGFMVSQRGIKANPDKIKAILEMQPPRNIKEIQGLTGRIAALNRFVSLSTDKCLPFFKVLRKAFEWIDECQKAFEELKKYLATHPLLSPSKPGEELYLYLAVSPTAINSALVREEEGQQLPVYYTSRALRGAEERYSPMEKLAFALMTATRKLRPYFQAHTIVLLTNHPLRKAMNKPDAAENLIQWSIELRQVNGDYEAKEERMQQYLNLVQHQISQFREGGILPSDRHEARRLKKYTKAFAETIQEHDPYQRRSLEQATIGRPYKWTPAHSFNTVTSVNGSPTYQPTSFTTKRTNANDGTLAVRAMGVLISDNGKQFNNPRFIQFSQELGIHNHYSSPGHPQANGQVEVTNRSLLKLIKTLLEGAKGLWPEELPSTLWTYRTTVRIPIGETPFPMTWKRGSCPRQNWTDDAPNLDI
uniref:Integrase catalytic domain-containing protein n=1 Tax=Fagus sylvatica TaxID=28930 RepID=A0A2N9H1Z5_FAGSY